MTKNDAVAESDPSAASESFKAAYRQSARMPEGLSDGVAIEGMQQFAAAVSPGTHPAAVMALERASPSCI